MPLCVFYTKSKSASFNMVRGGPANRAVKKAKIFALAKVWHTPHMSLEVLGFLKLSIYRSEVGIGCRELQKCWAVREQAACHASRVFTLVLRCFQGFRGRSKNCYSLAVRRVHKALQYQYVSRRLKKRDMRSVSLHRPHRILYAPTT